MTAAFFSPSETKLGEMLTPGCLKYMPTGIMLG